MKRVLTVLTGALLVFGLAGTALSQQTDNHSVTVTVTAINELAIVGGNIELTINSAAAGSEPSPVTDNTSTDLDWTTNEASKKVTVETDQASPNYTLSAEAQNVTGGTSAGSISLSTTATDFVTGISQTVGGSDLAYTATATIAAGAGSDVHVVTYTLTAI